MLCPHCGRELHAAPPRWVSFGLPLFLSLFALAVLASRWGGDNPIQWTLSRIGALSGQVVRLDETEPNVVIVMTPVPAGEQEGQPPGDQAEQPAADLAMAAFQPTADRFADATPPAPSALQAALEATLPAQPAVLVPTATPGQPQENQPQEGQAQSSPEAPAAQSPVETPAEAAVPPTPTPEPTATVTPTDSPTPQVAAEAVAAEAVAASVVEPVTYQVRAGDTLLGIAQRFDVDLDELMRVNNITPRQAYGLQPGQTLIIPVASDAAPTATDTPAPLPTSAPTSAPTNAPAATQAAIRLDAPILRSPESGTPVSCDTDYSLVWLGVPFIKADDKYLLHLGFVSGRTADNQEIVTWVLHQPRPANVTSWNLDPSLCSLAPQAFGRQWRWWVEVVEDRGGELVPVSRPSATWGFSWN